MKVDTINEKTLTGITFLVWGLGGGSFSISHYRADCRWISLQSDFFCYASFCVERQINYCEGKYGPK